MSKSAIIKASGCSRTTIHTEIKRGTVIQCKHKKQLGKSIDLQDESILTHEEFGHWELDIVREIKDKHDEVIISLLERKTRLYVTLHSLSAKAADIKGTLHNWLCPLSDTIPLNTLCKTITVDNGLEFASISELETTDLQIFSLIPMQHGNVALMNAIMAYCDVLSLKEHQFILLRREHLGELLNGVIIYLVNC